MGDSHSRAPSSRPSDPITPPGVKTPMIDCPSKAVEAALQAAQESPPRAVQSGFIEPACATW